jgi:uncharacterized protein YaaR (DUF327 family)
MVTLKYCKLIKNNVKDIFKTAYNAQNNLSFTGGSEKSSFDLVLVIQKRHMF